eukprot:GAFH01002122.1.p1 GENE.GAFH01002122.1~~GAFH01002122.1.p1  ORF type:complete len:421 (-),score=36.49 GAFH01002122.1:21-1208(-)
MLELLMEKKEPYTMKDLEKMGPREKGVTGPTVKEAVMQNVYDGLADTDKCGIQTLFWAFPSKALKVRQGKKAKLESELEECHTEIEALEAKKAELGHGREGSEDRTQRLRVLEELRRANADLQAQLQEHADNDPEVLKKMEAACPVARDAANRWTDNIFSIKKWCRDRFGVAEEEINAQFELPAEMEYVDLPAPVAATSTTPTATSSAPVATGCTPVVASPAPMATRKPVIADDDDDDEPAAPVDLATEAPPSPAPAVPGEPITIPESPLEIAGPAPVVAAADPPAPPAPVVGEPPAEDGQFNFGLEPLSQSTGGPAPAQPAAPPAPAPAPAPTPIRLDDDDDDDEEDAKPRRPTRKAATPQKSPRKRPAKKRHDSDEDSESPGEEEDDEYQDDD